MTTSFYRGQALGRQDLNLYLRNAANKPVNPAEISYSLYDFTTGEEVLVGPLRRDPANPAIGEYYCNITIPLDANLGDYRIRWNFREVLGGVPNQVVQEFSVLDKVGLSSIGASSITGGALGATTNELTLMARLRILLRDNSPDRNYRFRPPSHEETVQQHSRVFGYIWEDIELQEYLRTSLDMISASPPRTPFPSIDSLVQNYPEWRTLLLTGAMGFALNAVRINMIAEEFGYSIGGVSLDLERSSKYEGAYQAATEQFEKQLEQAKKTVKVIRGLQQPRFGIGIRSSFGPYAGAGPLTPAKFIGF